MRERIGGVWMGRGVGWNGRGMRGKDTKAGKS